MPLSPKDRDNYDAFRDIALGRNEDILSADSDSPSTSPPPLCAAQGCENVPREGSRYCSHVCLCYGRPRDDDENAPVGVADVVEVYAGPRVLSSDSPDGRPHYEGCWRVRGHHDCAIREIERLQSLLPPSPDPSR